MLRRPRLYQSCSAIEGGGGGGEEEEEEEEQGEGGRGGGGEEEEEEEQGEGGRGGGGGEEEEEEEQGEEEGGGGEEEEEEDRNSTGCRSRSSNETYCPLVQIYDHRGLQYKCKCSGNTTKIRQTYPMRVARLRGEERMENGSIELIPYLQGG